MKTIIFCAGAPLAYIEYIKHYTQPILVGVDGGARVLVEAGYTLDFAIGDFDSTTLPQAKESIVLPREKDDTDLHYAMKNVLSRFRFEEVDQVVVLGALGGGRVDHLLCNIWLAYHDTLNQWFPKLSLVDKKNQASFYLPGEYMLTREIDKKYLSFILMTPIKALTLANVMYPLNAKDYSTPVALISNEFLSDTMMFSFSEGIICVMQTVD